MARISAHGGCVRNVSGRTRFNEEAVGMSNIIECLAFALVRAIEVDLPDVKDWRWTYKSGERAKEEFERRPHSGEVEVYHFPQVWGSTALGFGGIGGQAMTTAYTTVIISEDCAAVYFAGRLAYKIQSPNEEFMCDLQAHAMASKGEACKYRIKE